MQYIIIIDSICVFLPGERHVLGIGEVTSKDILRKEVVHRLALGPSSRSEIVKNLPSKDPDDVIMILIVFP